MINITREQFFEFIKKEDETLNMSPDELSIATPHYMEYFDKYQRTGRKINWNWSVFCLFYVWTIWWLLYRNMYLYAFLHFVGIIFILGGLFSLSEPLPILLYILVVLIYAAFADYVYLSYVCRKIVDCNVVNGLADKTKINLGNETKDILIDNNKSDLKNEIGNGLNDKKKSNVNGRIVMVLLGVSAASAYKYSSKDVKAIPASSSYYPKRSQTSEAPDRFALIVQNLMPSKWKG